MAYTTADVLVKAVMECTTGLAADRVVNDWAFHFGTVDPDDAAIQALFDAVDGFYRDTQSNTHSVGEYLSPSINRSATHLLQAYTIKTPPLGSPRLEQSWLGPVNPGAANPFPQEVAACLSFRADVVGIPEHSGADRPKARRRGRVYVGPLMSNSLQGTVAPYLFDSTFLQTLRQAATAMAAEAGQAGWTWSVWSRKDTVLRAVVDGFTDNAPDTQRRRGPKANTRVTYSV